MGESSTDTPWQRRGQVVRFLVIGLSALLLLALATLYIARDGDSESGTSAAPSTVTSAGGQASQGKESPARIPGHTRIKIDITPRTAKIMVDGKPCHGGVIWLKTSTREHVLQAEHEGYEILLRTFDASIDRELKATMIRRKP